MPNRILKESICTSENIDQLSAFHETVFYRLMVNCDDYGRMDARPKLLASKLFPLKDIRTNQIEDALRALTSAELVDLYEVNGKPFLQMKTWDKHQQVRAKKSKYPSPEEGICNQLISDDSKCHRNPIQYESNTNPNTNMKSEPQKRFNPPTVDEVAEYCRERNNGINAQHFVDYYTQGNWILKNGRKMADWKAAVRTWEGNGYHNKPAIKTVPAQNYTQRDYSGEQAEAMARMLKGAAG